MTVISLCNKKYNKKYNNISNSTVSLSCSLSWLNQYLLHPMNSIFWPINNNIVNNIVSDNTVDILYYYLSFMMNIVFACNSIVVMRWSVNPFLKLHCKSFQEQKYRSNMDLVIHGFFLYMDLTQQMATANEKEPSDPWWRGKTKPLKNHFKNWNRGARNLEGGLYSVFLSLTHGFFLIHWGFRNGNPVDNEGQPVPTTLNNIIAFQNTCACIQLEAVQKLLYPGSINNLQVLENTNL